MLQLAAQLGHVHAEVVGLLLGIRCIHQLGVRYGFMEEPDLPALLATVGLPGGPAKPLETTWFLGRESVVRAKRSRLAPWRAGLFGVLNRNATPASDFFKLPPNRVVELGAQIAL